MRKNSNAKWSSVLDSIAVGLSGLCLVHCLALPLLIALFPLVGASFELIDHTTFHQLILVAVLPTSALALGSGYRRHHHKPAALLGIAGVAALVFAAFALHAFHAHHWRHGLPSPAGSRWPWRMSATFAAAGTPITATRA